MSHATPSLPKVASLWIGSELGLIEQLTIQSFLAHGHSFTLFTTEEVQGIPAGTVVRNANEIFPCQHIVRDYKTGSPAIHADMFRYAMLAKTELMWVDMDVLCLRPFYPNSPYVFAFEDENTVNNAVLRLPKDSPTLAALLAYQPETKGYPPFFSTGRKIRYWLKSGGKKPSINKWPWGSIGPKGLSYHLRQTSEIKHALHKKRSTPFLPKTPLHSLQGTPRYLICLRQTFFTFIYGAKNYAMLLLRTAYHQTVF